MELYNKKYVYFEWDDKLEGKEVFCATSIEDLKSQVDYGNAQTGVLHRSNNLKGHPFVPTWSDGSGSMAYPFAYYDPNYEVKKAYFKDGKKLQWKFRNEEDWNDWNSDSYPTFFDDNTGYELRVKPEDIDYDTGVIGDKVLPKPLVEEPEVIPKKTKPYKPLRSTKKTDNEKEIYKRFFRDTKERIKRQDIPLEDKLIITLIDMKNIITYMGGGVDNDVCEFVNTVRESIKPNIVEPVKNCRCKESTYNATSSKPYSFPCRSCTKVDEKCIPTDFEGGGCGECPKYEDRVWANILKNKKLAMWLAQGKGLAMSNRTGKKFTNYDYCEEDIPVDYMNIAVRKWDDTKWNYPTYGYCFGGK